jgi:hypothetical protein
MRYLKEYGPYHVVNLDLCGSMFPNTAKPPTEYYQALGEVLKFQCVRQNIEWLLFITTVVEPANVHVDELNKLCSPTRTNYDSHKDFAELLECLVPPSTFPTAPPPSIEVSELSEEQLVPNKLVESVANIRNVEDILANEPDLRSELRDAQARLLAMAGYDPEAYLKWVAEGEPSLSD